VQEQGDIVGVAIVGFWARGDARMTSDVDLAIVTEDKPQWAGRRSWFERRSGTP
jgi:predicted nucleotidyltransferase